GTTKVKNAVNPKNLSPVVKCSPIIFAKTSIEREPTPLTYDSIHKESLRINGAKKLSSSTDAVTLLALARRIAEIEAVPSNISKSLPPYTVSCSFKSLAKTRWLVIARVCLHVKSSKYNNPFIKITHIIITVND